MANYTIEQFYNSDKYNIHGEVFKDFWLNHQHCDPADETHIILMLTVKHTVLQTLNLIKNRDTILEVESELVSLLSYLEDHDGNTK
ncbi:hypothetical protein RFF05_04445 [Bengtsoniella intestinalis]|uniref:hypothetical protein n=1 Tax=Bengtsoniella intestinalis TaxID=3073143 RepID=UPI00391FB8DE